MIQKKKQKCINDNKFTINKELIEGNILDLTIAIPTRNEEKNLGICLNAIGNNFAKNITIIDSNSTDKTQDIARDFGAKIVKFNWNGKYPKKRNWYLEEHKPSTEWVLFLDADEIITEKFKEELLKIIPRTKHEAFEIKYTRYFLGKKLNGGYPLTKKALFRIGNIRYEYINENNWSNCDMEVHEHPEINGSVGLIKNTIEHRDERGLESYIEKHNEYAKWEANKIFEERNTNRKRFKKQDVRKRIKYLILSSHLSGIIFFLGSYIFMNGWKDGKRGVVFAIMKAGYYTQIYCRLKEIESKYEQVNNRYLHRILK